MMFYRGNTGYDFRSNVLTNANSNKVGTLCKMQIKIQFNDLSIPLNQYLIKFTSKTRYLGFKLINVIVFFFIANIN